MSVRFNDFNKDYGKYNLFLTGAKNKEVQKEEETKETKTNSSFLGLENETDLLTKNPQNIYGLNFTKSNRQNNEIADKTNEILASLGYTRYKVTPAQVASVANGMNVVVMPGLKLAEDGAVAAHIQDPNGPFSDLFN